ncbi:hypothetical protein VTL71DRAFT_2399 [Oculimacula yallundae]|uniref:Uncharacterized protein n=1 Tax=Oculimacula yallundae TaxID=86028 RepID=A0ABR4C8R6_9HELO
MGPARNPFVSGEGRGRGQAGPSSGVPDTGNRISKNDYTPPRRGWNNPSRLDTPSYQPRLPDTSPGIHQSSASPPRPDFSGFGFPSQSRAPETRSLISQIGPRQSLASQSRTSFDFDWSSSVASSDDGIEEVPIDEPGFQEIDMDLIYDEIEDVLDTNHTEMQHRLESEPTSSTTVTISQHLVSPPNSPSIPVPRSPDTEEYLRNLQQQTLQDLMQSDRQLHEYQHEITSIREWWLANKGIWRQQKDKLESIEMSIETLQERQFQLTVFQSARDDQNSNDNTFAYVPQIEEQIKAKKPLLDWFRANALQMKQVYAQYKALEAQISQMSFIETSQGLSLFSSQLNGGRRLSFMYDDGRRRVESLSWYRPRKLVTWAAPAKRDIAAHLHRLVDFSGELKAAMKKLAKSIDKLEDKSNQQRRQNVKREEEAEDHAERLKLSGSSKEVEADIDAVMAKRQGEKLLAVVQYNNNQAKRRILLKRKEAMVFLSEVIEAEILRGSTVDCILDYVLRREKEIAGKGLLDLDNMEFVNDLYAICWLYNERDNWSSELIEILQDDSRLLGENRVEILEIASNLYTKHRAARQHLLRTNDPQGFSFQSIRSLRNIFQEENLEYKNMMENGIRDIYRRRDSVKILKTQGIKPPPPAEYLLRPKFSLLGTGISTAEATDILAQEYFRERQPQKRDKSSPWDGPVCVHDVLTRFFTSPDIFPIFRCKEASWTFEKFVATVNAFLATPLTSEVLGAFLHYSHRFRQLFRITYLTRRIRSLQGPVTGWETCEENPVDGPLRSRSEEASLKKPVGLDDIESLILTRIEEFREAPRDIIPGSLLDRINSWPPKKKVTFFETHTAIKDHIFRRYLMYWSITGTFFVYQNPVLVGEKNYLAQNMIRVDNGWPVNWGTKYEIPTPLPVLSLLKNHFKDIEQDIYDSYTSNIDTYRRIQGMKTELGGEFEWVLYNQIYNRGAASAFLSQKVSRHMFHLFLRNCREKNILFTRAFLFYKLIELRLKDETKWYSAIFGSILAIK